MTLIGTWQVVGLPDRELVFGPDGTGHFNVQGERMPFIKWSLTETGRLRWQFFLNEAMTQTASREHEPQYEVCDGEAELRFERAPFPFGIKHFRRQGAPDV